MRVDARASFTAADFEVIRDAFLSKRLEAGQFLQRAGDAVALLR